ncbi:5-oxoprolinase subunit B family protein [Saccharomonospora saliphila]|uniref:5-oxoprolinase subunit B family protein n=1 Tax=Saccharomonospora saliphila TaxID=369829 RepID=UPI00036711A7|nr:allophanate hydrolase subunit 1 [Saccharomonospora saliphila]
MRVLPCADVGLLVELDDLDAVRALHAALEADPPPGVIDLVPAARTLLVRLDPDTSDPERVEHAVRRVRPLRTGGGAVPGSDAPVVEIPVLYDGADLAEVARLTGLSENGVVAAHTGTEWTVAFGGFAPGFGYLTGAGWSFDVPRRAEPRTVVPEGAVGLAGVFSGVYPRSSPGGWQLIGHTRTRLWSVEADPPALLRPGVRVRFLEAT